MSKVLATIALLLLISHLGVVIASAASAIEGLDWIKTVVGEWEGTYVWTGENTGSGEIQAKYYLTGNGSAVIEDHYYSGADPVMSSVFHVDGDDLRMTHFCAGANQPRLRADTIDSGEHSVFFSMVDITNLASPDAGHVNSVKLEFPSDDELIVEFGYTRAGKKSLERIELRRVTD